MAKFFLEAKKPFVNIMQNWEPAYQLRRYAWSAKLAVSLLTDFEELAIYDCRIAPRQLEKPSTARREYIGYRGCPDRFLAMSARRRRPARSASITSSTCTAIAGPSP